MQARCLDPAPQKTAHVWRPRGVVDGEPPRHVRHPRPGAHLTTRMMRHDKLLNPQGFPFGIRGAPPSNTRSKGMVYQGAAS